MSNSEKKTTITDEHSQRLIWLRKLEWCNKDAGPNTITTITVKDLKQLLEKALA